MTAPPSLSAGTRRFDVLSRPVQWDAVIAGLAVGLSAMRIALPLNIPASMVVGVVLLPVILPALARFKDVRALLVMIVVAAGSGIFITLSIVTPTSTSLMLSQTLRLLSVAVAVAVLLWARTTIGLRRVILCYGVGLLASIPFTGINPLNPWKFAFGLPVTLIVLSLSVVYRHRIAQLVAALGLTAVNAVFDSRSAAGFLLVAAALTLTVSRPSVDAAKIRRRSTWPRYVQLATVVGGAYFLLQAALLEGVLGEEAQTRTAAQVQLGGTALVGGRPEIGATVSLLTANPLGYGSGALPTPSQVLLAKTGMAQLGYDPNNGYVERYMFGTSFEVHSGIGDLWLHFGLAGVLLAVVLIVVLLRGLGRGLVTGTMSTVGVYLFVRAIWDLGFSPFYTSVALLPLTIAALAVARLRSESIETAP